MDFATLAGQMPSQVPMVGTLNIEFLELEPQRVLLRLPDQPEYHNHIGGLHAGAMFTLAETATGALVLGNFGMHLARAVPLAVEGSIHYLKIARGPVFAEAAMAESADEILATLDDGKRPEWRIPVKLSVEDGTVTGESSFVWTLKPTRR
jgi:uncharacterized protein (TIGR00369 family)